MIDPTTELTISQVTERTGLSAHALRFYEKEGLLAAAVRRGANGRRVCTERDVEWLVNCTKFRASEMPLATIRRLAELVRQGPGNEQDRLELLREHQHHIVDRIAELTDCLALITTKVQVYEEHFSLGTAHDLWREPAAD